MENKWWLIVLGVVAIVVVVALVGLNMNRDASTNTMDLTDNPRVENNNYIDERGNVDSVDLTDFYSVRDEAKIIAQDVSNGVKNFTKDTLDAFNTAYDEVTTYDKEERKSQEEVDRRSKNLREAIDNLVLMDEDNTDNINNTRNNM